MPCSEGESEEAKTVKTITPNAFGSRRCNKACSRRRISSDLFGSCLSFRGCRTSPREASSPEGAHGWIRYMNKPPRLHHHIIQHSTSNVWFDSIQSESDGDHFLQPPPLLPVLEGCCVEEYGSGLIVVRARPWEEEHGKILEMKHVRPKR